MEEIFNSIVSIDDEYILPVAYKWKKVYKFAIEKLKDNNKDLLSKKLDILIFLLTTMGDVYEDVVLKTAIYYFLCLNTNLKLDEIKESTSVVEGTNILIKNHNVENLKEVFQNENYRYLNKIKLAYLICELEIEKKSNNIVKTLKLTNECKIILSKYKDFCYKKLYNQLKNKL